MRVLSDAMAELRGIFKANPDKYEAHHRAGPLLVSMSREPQIIAELLERHIETPGALDRGHYPVVALEGELNPWFGINANCWLPMPDGNTNLSTKAIHHHGELLLTTVTLLGPGYEHWTFTTPERREDQSGLYSMRLIEAASHPQHHVAFVDAYHPHTPFFPPDLSITFALFSSRSPTTWRDHVKRLPGLRGREKSLRKLVRKLGLGRALSIKTVDSFDFHPATGGFAVVRERKEFELGPNRDHIASLFHVIQRTGNEQLANRIGRLLRDGKIGAGHAAVKEFLPALQSGIPIAPRLSPGHTNRPDANFTRQDIERALAAQGA